MPSDKKVALITGANRGIGLETAKQLGEKGVTVVVAARKLSDAEQTAAKLKASGIDAYPVKLDVTSAADRTTAAQYRRRRLVARLHPDRHRDQRRRVTEYL
jgi:NAD(P)-dependent dehydrogenase (short-subunit alcohol dehydrogenase family)